MVEKLRDEGKNGFLFANGGFATDNHCIVLSKAPVEHATFPQSFDFQAEADALRGPVPELDQDYCGPAAIESFTLFHDRSGTPSAGVVIARSNDGKRTLANIDVSDLSQLAFFTDGGIEPIGQMGHITADGEHGRIWSN